MVTAPLPDDDQLVTRGFLRTYVHEELTRELARSKRSILLWILAMQAPIYAALIYLTMKAG